MLIIGHHGLTFVSLLRTWFDSNSCDHISKIPLYVLKSFSVTEHCYTDCTYSVSMPLNLYPTTNVIKIE